jgi:alpha-galactosidase
MKTLRKRFLSSTLSLILASPALAADPSFHSWAERPIMGWNSWDFYGTSVNEQNIRNQADYMAANLLSHGWNLITVDIQWYEPNATGFDYVANATLTLDSYSRLIPASNRFPSAANGVGFKALADYVHSKGLKFGIHMMRGISKQAYNLNTPILGTTHTARDIADTSSTCSWNPDMYGVDMSKPGAQEYYNSILNLCASWGVDFIKVDDLSRPYHRAEIEGLRKAIDQCGRNIVFSTSPGDTPVDKGSHVMANANQWRISDDFWDSWTPLYEQFQRLQDWTPYRGPGHFPDADMLPLGKLKGGSPTATGRATYFTQNEQYTMMTLWSIARSPLIHGGDMTQMDSFTLSLLTNDEVIEVNQHSKSNRQLFRNGDQVAWTADSDNSSDKYLAVFNTGTASTTIPVTLSTMGFTGNVSVRSLWDHTDLGTVSGTFSPAVPSHGAVLYRLSGASMPVPWLSSAKKADRSVTLTWAATSGAGSYRVKRGTAITGPFTTVGDNLTGTTYTDASLTNGTTYYYTVSAIINGSETPNSNVISATPSPQAGPVSWNYDRYGSVSGSASAGANASANWNNSYPNNPVSNLIDANGFQTTLDISYSSYNTWSITSSTPALDSNGSSNKRMLNGYLNAGNASWGPTITKSSVTLSEIPYDYYDMIVYFSSDGAGREGMVTNGSSSYYFSTIGPASISGANATLIQTTQTNSSAYPQANYAVFSGMSGDSRTISVQMRDNDEWGGIAAFQIVPQSDPLAQTQLQISISGTPPNVSLSWPSGLGNLVLEASSDLSDWLPHDPQPTTNHLTFSPDKPKRFFRLNRP